MKLELKLKSIFNVTLKKAGQDRTGSGCRILAGQVIGHEKVSTCSALGAKAIINVFKYSNKIRHDKSKYKCYTIENT